MSGRLTLLLMACAAAALIGTPAIAGPGDHSVPWTEYVRSLWPVFLVVTGLIATGVLLGLTTRFPTVAAFDRLKQRVDGHEKEIGTHVGRLRRLEEICAESPTRQELQEDIAELGERLAGVEASVGGVSDQLRTTNAYLHTLIERGLQAK